VSLLSGIGAGIRGRFFSHVVWELIAGVVLGWLLWSVVTYFIGTSLFGGKTTVEEMLRVLGYASAPRLLGFFGFIPCVGWRSLARFSRSSPASSRCARRWNLTPARLSLRWSSAGLCT